MGTMQRAERRQAVSPRAEGCDAMNDHDRPKWAQRLQDEREARGWGKWEMARQLLASVGIAHPKPDQVKNMARQILEWEKGNHFPRDWADAYTSTFDVPRDELFGRPSVLEPVGTVVLGTTPNSGDDDVRRRRLLESLAILGAVTTVEGKALTAIREAFNSAFVQAGEEITAEEWLEISEEYAHAYLVTPHYLLLPDLAADIVAFQEIADRGGRSEHSGDFYSAGARLAAIMAMTSNSLGLERESRAWWRSSRHLAKVAGNRDLTIWIEGYESVDALYQGRPIRLVLDRAESAIQRADGRPSPGALEAMACKAQVLAQAGAEGEAQSALRQTRSAFESLPDGLTQDRVSLLAWPEQRLLHTESFVHSMVGTPSEAEQAHSVAYSAYGPDRLLSRAQISLHRAATLVRSGHIGEGITQAEAVFDDFQAVRQSRYVRVIAGRVITAVPDSELQRPAVRELRERLASPPQNEESQ
jgi:hypothetical protein